jgi:hypothetical protein
VNKLVNLSFRLLGEAKTAGGRNRSALRQHAKVSEQSRGLLRRPCQIEPTVLERCIGPGPISATVDHGAVDVFAIDEVLLINRDCLAANYFILNDLH